MNSVKKILQDTSRYTGTAKFELCGQCCARWVLVVLVQVPWVPGYPLRSCYLGTGMAMVAGFWYDGGQLARALPK